MVQKHSTNNLHPMTLGSTILKRLQAHSKHKLQMKHVALWKTQPNAKNTTRDG